MKISIFSLPQIPLGKHNIKDKRLDQLDSIVKANKKTQIQVELTGEDAALDADVILAVKSSSSDLILKDLEFVETRLGRAEGEQEKTLLNKLKGILENEGLIFNAPLSQEEKEAISGYGLLTNKSITITEEKDLNEIDILFSKVLRESGFVSFFTTTGGKETRAWLIKKGTTAFEAAGAVHSDIQKGFIRAEIISFDDFVNSGGETGAKQKGLMHLEQKDYVLQDGDVVNFRFNK